MNELLDLLEQRILPLVDEVDVLRRENARLLRDLAEKTGALAEENEKLKSALTQEKTARETAAARISALLERLTDRMPE